MNPKFYEAENCNRAFVHGNTTIKFRQWGTHGGCPCGVYLAESAEDQKALEELAKDKKNLISEITRDEFDRRIETFQLRQPMNVTSADGTSGQRARRPLPKTTVSVSQPVGISAPIRTDTEKSRAAMAKILSASEDAPVAPVEASKPPSIDAILTPGKIEPAAGQK